MGRYTKTAMGALTGADLAVMEGQAHGAMRTGPEQVAAEIREYF